MNVKEISKRLYAMRDSITDKFGEAPFIDPKVSIGDDICRINLYREHRAEGYSLGCASGETTDDALDAADAIIAALPSRENRAMHDHIKRVADCVEKARADNIPDEYVTPLSVTVKAMTDNLLEGPK